METETGLMRAPQQSFALVPMTLGEAVEMAKLITSTELCPQRYRGKHAEAIVAYDYGRSLGLSWMQALRSVAVINGTPTLYGDAVAAVIYGSGQCEQFDETYEGTPFQDNFLAKCLIKRKGLLHPVVRTFSVGDAKTARLWEKRGRDGSDTPWITYPKRMLQMRARGFAARDAFPDRLAGLILYEEAMDYPEAIDVVPERVERVEDPLEVIPEDFREAVVKGFAELNMGNGPRLAKIREFMHQRDQTSADENAQSLLDWLRDEFSRRKTGKPRAQNGKTAPKADPSTAAIPVTSNYASSGQPAGATAETRPTSPAPPATSSGSPETTAMPAAATIFKTPEPASLQAVEF